MISRSADGATENADKILLIEFYELQNAMLVYLSLIYRFNITNYPVFI